MVCLKKRFCFIWTLMGMAFFLMAGVAGEQRAYGAEAGLSLLSPPPQSMEYLGGRLFLTPAVNLTVKASTDTAAVRELRQFLLESGFRIHEQPDASSIHIEIRTDQGARRLRPQGYTLNIGENNLNQSVISIQGNDGAGTFYGVQTLKQLIRAGSNMFVPKLRIIDFPQFPSRGVVEGFYGTPWTHQQRLEQLQFYGERKLSAYIYAPKDDPYHRSKWREPYPASEMERMRELIGAAKANHVEFVFAISPGIDIKFDGRAGERDFAALLAKLSSLYDMGVRRFAIFYDDIEDKSGGKQAAVLNRILEEFVRVKGDVKPLLTVPTEYYTLDMLDIDGNKKPYTQAFSKTLAPEIAVMYTGETVVCEGISPEELHAVNQLYGREMAIWWNYPVTDYLQGKLALGPLIGLDRQLSEMTDELMINPMEHAELSQLTLFTAAEYAWNPNDYDPEAALQRAAQTLYSDLAEEMALLAAHSSRMDNDWAHTGMQDAPALRKAMDALWEGLSAGRDCTAEIASLYEAFDHMERVAARLRRELPLSILRECAAQVALFERLAEYDAIALAMVEAQLRCDEDLYQRLRAQTLANQTVIENGKERISDKTAMAFIAEALAFAERK